MKFVNTLQVSTIAHWGSSGTIPFLTHRPFNACCTTHMQTGGKRFQIPDLLVYTVNQLCNVSLPQLKWIKLSKKLLKVIKGCSVIPCFTNLDSALNRRMIFIHTYIWISYLSIGNAVNICTKWNVTVAFPPISFNVIFRELLQCNDGNDRCNKNDATEDKASEKNNVKLLN